jgi:hypothetical protein
MHGSRKRAFNLLSNCLKLKQGKKLWGELKEYLSLIRHGLTEKDASNSSHGYPKDLQIWKVKEEIRCYSSQYRARLSAHPNDLIVNLIELDNRRLRGHLPNDLPTRFLV